MTIESAAQTIWDYMLMHHKLKKADVIFVLGNRDTRVAERAAELFLEGWAPILLCGGSGSIHENKPGREKFKGTTEAEVFAEIAIAKGVSKKKIIIENESQSTAENFAFGMKKLNEHGIFPKTVIAVQKPYMERRTYATGMARWKDVEIMVTSPQLPLDEFLNEGRDLEYTINCMVGDLQRIIEYPRLGYQIEQNVPNDVLEAYKYLIDKGYTERLIKK